MLPLLEIDQHARTIFIANREDPRVYMQPILHPIFGKDRMPHRSPRLVPPFEWLIVEQRQVESTVHFTAQHRTHFQLREPRWYEL